MDYRLLSDPEQIRCQFIGEFVKPYELFSVHHKEWIARLRTDFTEEYYDKMFMWNRIINAAHAIRFADALTTLKDKVGEVLFLTESPQCCTRQFCRLNNHIEFVAAAEARKLAECISCEWFTEYELNDQGCYLEDPILPSDLYVFDESYSWCLIFTHETDETETAESRFCLLIDQNAPNL